MKKNHKLVGLISTMSLDKTWAPEVIKRVSKTHGVIKKAIEDLGFEVVDDGPIHRTYQEMMTAGKNLRAKGINALVIYVGTWTYANCAGAAALEAGVPVVVLPDAIPTTCGLVGGAIAQGAMGEYGVHSNMIYGPLDDKKTKTRLQKVLNAYCAAMGLRGQVLGIGGGRSMGMVTAVVDPNQVRLQFGVEIDSFEQLEVIELAEKIDEKRVQEFMKWMKKTFGKFIVSDIALTKQIRLHLALSDFIKDKEYDLVALKCLPELPAIYTTFCLAHSILGDAQDAFGAKERIVMSCEADLNAALTMQMMKMLTDGPVMFADLTEFDFKADMLTCCNCGSQPTDFAKSKKDVNWEIEGVHEFNWKFGGACPQHVTKSGRATLARLSRVNGKFEMLIAPVESVNQPREKLKNLIWERPHTFLNLLCDRDKFFSSVHSNHFHLIFGDYSEELHELCRILKINPVVLEEIKKGK
jgi:L-fucose isomerase